MCQGLVKPHSDWSILHETAGAYWLFLFKEKLTNQGQELPLNRVLLSKDKSQENQRQRVCVYDK